MRHRLSPVTAATAHSVRLSVAAIATLALGVGAVGCSSDDDSNLFGTSTTVAPSLPPTPASTTSTSTSTTSTTSTTTTSTTLPPTTTTEPIVTVGSIVLVANASRVPGAAARLTASLVEIGFTANSPVNAAGSDEFLETTQIYARDVDDPVARSISRLMGGVPVLRMPTPVPVESGLAGDATVVVMLGRDLAEAPLQGVAG